MTGANWSLAQGCVQTQWCAMNQKQTPIVWFVKMQNGSSITSSMISVSPLCACHERLIIIIIDPVQPC